MSVVVKCKRVILPLFERRSECERTRVVSLGAWAREQEGFCGVTERACAQIRETENKEDRTTKRRDQGRRLL